MISASEDTGLGICRSLKTRSESVGLWRHRVRICQSLKTPIGICRSLKTPGQNLSVSQDSASKSVRTPEALQVSEDNKASDREPLLHYRTLKQRPTVKNALKRTLLKNKLSLISNVKWKTGLFVGALLCRPLCLAASRQQKDKIMSEPYPSAISIHYYIVLLHLPELFVVIRCLHRWSNCCLCVSLGFLLAHYYWVRLPGQPSTKYGVLTT